MSGPRINRHNRPPRPQRHRPPLSRAIPEGSGLTFAQRASSPKVAGTDGVTHESITCFACQSIGHYSSDCPGPTTDKKADKAAATTLTQHAYMLAQADRAAVGIDPSWILLDSQSTISVFRNPNFLSNIRKSGHVLRAITNGGHQDSDTVGDFPNLGEVWYNPESIANILSLADVRKVCRVTMDSSVEPAIKVHRLDGSVMTFTEHGSGLYVYKTNDHSSKSVAHYTMISTVADQKKFFSRREVQSADLARDLYRKLGRPSAAEFLSILRNNLIRNCPVTADDASRASIIYGPDVATIKGTTTRIAAAGHVPTFVAVPIPAPVLEHHANVTLCVDFFFVQGIGFLHTISRGIGFRTATLISDRNKTTILRELGAVLQLYETRGFTVRDVHADHEFHCIREDIRPIHLNIVPPDSHVGEVERSIRTIKERLRSCVHGLPFKRLPRLLVSHMVSHAVRCLNLFPWQNGISSTLSPAGIVLGTAPPDYNNMRVEFGSYVQVFEDNNPTNTPRARTLGAVALNPTGNTQGDFYFLSLATGAQISRHHWIEVPMTDTAIARVEALALHEQQPLVQERGLVVEWRPDHPIDDSEYDLDFLPPQDPVDDALGADDFDPILAEELHDLYVPPPLFVPDAPVLAAGQGAIDGGAANHENENEHEPAADDANEDAGNEQQNEPAAADANEDAGNEYELAVAHNDDFEEDAHAEAHEHENDENHENQGAAADAEVVAPHNPPGEEQANADIADDATVRTYNLRARQPKSNFNHAMDSPHSGKSYFAPHGTTNVQYGASHHRAQIYGFIMTQMSAKAGIKKHGKAAEAAMMKEFAQLENLNVYQALDPTTLTPQQKRGALRAINLIKEKRDGQLKGRTVADGRPQRSLYDKSETASPTVSSDALVLSIVVDAHENRDVATADVTGAYLKADMDDFVIMKFTGASVDLICEMNPEHLPFVTIEHGTKVLYVKLEKAMYGCVKSALLWYNVFHGALKEMGFKINPYDSCIANCDINGSQCTIAWYVDDTKISHVDPNVVTSTIDLIEKKFGKMTVTRGKEHSFLGMKIRYTEESTAVISMKTYLQEAIDESGLDIQRVATTPAKKNLFDVNDEAAPLDKIESESFHSVVAKLLYVSTRARMDLLLAVGFLCTRVSKSTTEDQAKLKRVLEYIKGTMDLEYTVGADTMSKLRTWVDASYAVHPDMKSHTGGVMSLGIGGIICKSTKQKLNTKSSTEAELVGASDYLPNTMWVKMYLEAQGYSIDENFLEQDNESAIKLEQNGPRVCGTSLPTHRHPILLGKGSHKGSWHHDTPLSHTSNAW